VTDPYVDLLVEEQAKLDAADHAMADALIDATPDGSIRGAAKAWVRWAAQATRNAYYWEVRAKQAERPKEAIMSWSVSRIGTREAVIRDVTADFDKCAANYPGKPEGEDILKIKAIVLGSIETLDLKADGYAVNGWGVKVSANGSRSDTYSSSGNYSVERATIST